MSDTAFTFDTLSTATITVCSAVGPFGPYVISSVLSMPEGVTLRIGVNTADYVFTAIKMEGDNAL